MRTLRVNPTDRRRLLAASVVTLVALPIVIHENRQQDREPTVAVVAPDAGLASQLQPAAAASAGATATGGALTAVAAATTAPVTAPPAASAAPATAAPVAAAPVTAPGLPTEGDATWDRWPAGSVPAGAPCVTPLAPLGSEVTVTNLDTGRRASCTVVDQAALPEGVIVKLDAPVFQTLADLGEQPIPVRLSA